MASSLTSTSLRSGFLYFVLLIFLVFGALYLFFVQKPSAVDNLNRHAFRLNYSAFKNSIKLANYKYIAALASQKKSKQFNLWIDGQEGLDYNLNGFPIGTDLSNPSHQEPQSANHCLQIWQFILGPLQPPINLTPTVEGYWTELDKDAVCIYRSTNVENFAVLYDSSQGNVLLIGLTN